jgi:hypothetical protein
MGKFRILTACMLALATSTAAAAPSEADWARCAAIDAADARLACYDGLGVRPRPTASSPNSASAPIAAPAVAPLAAPAAALPAAAAAPSAPPQPIDDPKNFGLTPAQQHIVATGPSSITARVASMASDSIGHATIALDNDQTWSVTDYDGQLSSGDTVRIKRGALGSFILLTRSNHTYHVRRLH